MSKAILDLRVHRGLLDHRVSKVCQVPKVYKVSKALKGNKDYPVCLGNKAHQG